MSFSELLVVILILFVVLKPEDIPKLAGFLKSLHKSIFKIKSQFKKEFLDISDKVAFDPKDKDTINFYLTKISELGSEYEGDYDINKVKSFYHKILKEDQTGGK